jgi:SAM-dependent methyltransferase
MTSKLKNLWRMASGPVRERGWRETVRSVRSCLHDRARERDEPFDATFGTDTARSVTLADLDATGADVPALWRYWPTPRATFHRIMQDVLLPFSETAFIDLGSGKGRVVLMASEYPFRRIMGIELSPALHAVARDNLDRWRSPTRRCAAIELLCLDARDFVPPSGDALIYLFQPFPDETMRAVLAQLGHSLRDEPRHIHLAYLNPLHHALILASGQFTLARWGHATHKGEFEWAIYRSSTARRG